MGYGIGFRVGRPRTGWAESKADEPPRRRKPKRGLFAATDLPAALDRLAARLETP